MKCIPVYLTLRREKAESIAKIKKMSYITLIKFSSVSKALDIGSLFGKKLRLS